MPGTYSIELRLIGRPVVVIGGGTVGARKVAGLVEAGAKVTVVSPRFCPQLMDRQDITLVQSVYAPAHLTGAVLAFACTDDARVNAQVAADAEQIGIWCNLADDSEGGTFHVPAVFRQGELTVSVSTGGASPHLAAALRDRIASQFGPEWGILIEELARARRLLKERVSDPQVRRQILDMLCADCSVELLTRRDRDAWRNWFERLTEYRLKGAADAPDGL